MWIKLNTPTYNRDCVVAQRDMSSDAAVKGSNLFSFWEPLPVCNHIDVFVDRIVDEIGFRIPCRTV
jgi:hypothetical protein